MQRSTFLRPEDGGKIGRHGTVGPDPKTHPALAELRGDNELRKLGQQRDEQMMAEVAKKKGLPLSAGVPLSAAQTAKLASGASVTVIAGGGGQGGTSYSVGSGGSGGVVNADPHALTNRLGMEALVSRAKYLGIHDADALTWEGLLNAYEAAISKQAQARHDSSAPAHLVITQWAKDAGVAHVGRSYNDVMNDIMVAHARSLKDRVSTVITEMDKIVDAARGKAAPISRQWLKRLRNHLQGRPLNA
jgi:hypothetical protein